MYGYIRAYRPELRFREYDTYRGCYCGLCEALKCQYGTPARFMVSYDMTFLILLLDGLYEPEEQLVKKRCPARPFQKHLHISCNVTNYAADMSVLLFRDKCMDDWNDERKPTRRAAAAMLSRSYRAVQARYPEKAQLVQQQLAQLRRLEQAGETNPDLPAGCFGTLLGEIFVWKHDEWEQTLREMGFYLGKYIYLLDAYDDLEHDRKKGCYNPLLLLQEQMENFDSTCQALLQAMMAPCAAAFERLPILRHEDILRNILYAGVWTKFQQKRQNRNEKQEKHNHGSI